MFITEPVFKGKIKWKHIPKICLSVVVEINSIFSASPSSSYISLLSSSMFLTDFFIHLLLFADEPLVLNSIISFDAFTVLFKKSIISLRVSFPSISFPNIFLTSLTVYSFSESLRITLLSNLSVKKYS